MGIEYFIPRHFVGGCSNTGRFPLTLHDMPVGYTERVMGATPGVYLFRRNGWPAYVGRGDHDVELRARRSVTEGLYDCNYDVYPVSSARQAYLLECRLFHRHDPPDNLRHPAAPPGTNWRCPDKSCPWS